MYTYNYQFDDGNFNFKVLVELLFDKMRNRHLVRQFEENKEIRFILILVLEELCENFCLQID